MGSDKIARALVACSRWVWLPGMRAGYVFADSPDDLWWDRLHGEPGHLVGAAQGLEVHPSGTYPNPTTHVAVDITDPATLGCIFQVVVEAHRKAVSFRPRPCGLFGVVVTVGDIGHGDEEQRFSATTTGEALLLALQAAPEAS